MDDREALDKFHQAVDMQPITEDAKIALKAIGCTKCGILLRASSWIIAQVLNKSPDDVLVLLTELQTAGLILQETIDGHTWLAVNFRRLQIKKEVWSNLFIVPQFKEIGTPHSPEGLSTLRDFFRSSSRIYIVLSLTAPDVFDELENRCVLGYETTFIFPGKRFTDKNRQQYRYELLQKWVKHVSNLKPAYRNFVQFHIAREDSTDVYTCALSNDCGRINFIGRNSPTTRSGIIFEVSNDITLYSIFKNRVLSLYRNSSPLFALHPYECCRFWMIRCAWPLTLIVLAVVVLKVGGAVSAIMAGIAIGLLKDWISGFWKVER
jgi:hypothetical protein